MIEIKQGVREFGKLSDHLETGAMMMRLAIVLISIGAATSVWAAPDLSECRFTEPPQIITGIDATPNQMRSLADVVKAYLEDMNRSLACLDAKEAALGAGVLTEDKALIDAVYNQGVEQMQVIAKGYNDQLDVFKYKERLPQSDQGVDVIKRGNRAPSTRQSSDED